MRKKADGSRKKKLQKVKNKSSSKKEEKYIITGRKWFDKVNGNTYHSAQIIRVSDNKEIYDSGMVYGYGEQWKQTAYDELIKRGLVKKEDRFNHDKNRKRFIYQDVGYGLKRDL